MNIAIALDLQDILQKALAPERLQPIIDKAVTAAVSQAIHDATGYRSEFAEQLKKQLTQAMPHGLDIDGIAKFQHVFNAQISAIVQGENAKTIQCAIQSAMKSAIPELPERIKLSDIVKGARGNFNLGDGEEFFAEYDVSEWGGGSLYMSEIKAGRHSHSEYNSDIILHFNSDGEVYALKVKEKHVTPATLPETIGRYEGVLLALYTGRCKVEVDIDRDDVEALASSQSDG